MKMASLLTLLLCLLFPLTVTASNGQLSTIAARSMNMAGQVAAANTLKVASREHALQLVKRQYQGKVLKVQSRRVNGHPAYRVKLLSQKGVVFYVTVDAQTGRVSRN